jgi:hypothetical protein
MQGKVVYPGTDWLVTIFPCSYIHRNSIIKVSHAHVGGLPFDTNFFKK